MVPSNRKHVLSSEFEWDDSADDANEPVKGDMGEDTADVANPARSSWGVR
ncbi:MAG: hypothetical protein MI861_26390 [Pirellulales bacterium]|nr:hypothetical protein [Pirellulales bacterium]